MKQLNVGIVGCGNIFPMHAYPTNNIDGVKLVAVCDIKEDRAKAKAEIFGCDYYTDYKQMIDKAGIDVVHICTPHYLHAPIAIYAAQNKKHILTEKPMSINLDDAEAMIKTAKDNNVTLGVIFQNRYNQASVVIKDLITSGQLGKIKGGKLSVTWDRSDEYYSKSDWKGTWDKEGGGVVIDQAIHTLDLVNWFMDSPISYIDASIGNRAHEKIQVEDVAEGVIKYKNGVNVGFFTINYYSYDAPVEIELHCEQGLVKMISDKATITFNNGKTIVVDKDPNEVFEYDGTAKNYWGVSHVKQIKNFYEAINNNTKPEIDGNEALKTQKVVCGIYKSGKDKVRVNFDLNI